MARGIVVALFVVVVWLGARPASAQQTCWSGQVYAPSLGRCVGVPMCPPGMSPVGEQCVAAVGPNLAYGAQLPEPQVSSEPIWGLVIAGISVWGAAWVAGPVVTAAVGGDGGEIGLFAIPFAGPWVCLAACYEPEPYLAAIVVDGVAQIAGLTMFILGLAIRHEVRVGYGSERPSWALLPWADERGGGLTFGWEG